MYTTLFSSFPSTSVTYHNQYGNRLPKQGWSKWGGGISEQIKTLPSYMFPTDLSNREFVRVCSGCKSKSYTHRVTICWDLIRIIKGN
jgi:hypothetical protein